MLVSIIDGGSLVGYGNVKGGERGKVLVYSKDNCES